MKITLKQELDQVKDELSKERERRYRAESDFSSAQSQLKRYEQDVWGANRQVADLERRLNGANGHIAGLREILIGMGFMEEPAPIEVPPKCPNCRHQEFPETRTLRGY